MFRPYFSPREKGNSVFEQYMRQTLLAYKPFSKKEEITNLDSEELKEEFMEFKASSICPAFVIEAYTKANEKRKKKKEMPNTSQDEVEKEALANSDNESSDDEVLDYVPVPNPENERNNPEAQIPGPPPIAKFTEA